MEGITSLLSKDLKLEEIPTLSEDELMEFISRKVNYWLGSDFSHLLNVMYRLDIDQVKFERALYAPDPSLEITKLIIAKELQKLQWRQKYNDRY